MVASIAVGSASTLLTSMLTHDDKEAAGYVAHTQAHQANDLHKWSHVGLPAFDTTYIFRENFVICYDSRTRNPKWVMERLTKETCTGEADRRVVGFYEEGSVDPRFRSKNSDYLNSGYDRGHMAPAANNRSSTQTMQETFSLANVSPQVGGGFNRDYWARFVGAEKREGRRKGIGTRG
jgi:DNA/RNA endonuclease G (NUC1)